MFGSSPTPSISRGTAMNARPIKLPAKAIEEREGKVYVTIEFQRPRWQQFLGAEAICERTFGLDAYGQSVFHACDGNRTVKQIVKHFARRHKISIAEAEVAVTTFLKTLMSRGIIGMEMEES